MNGTEKFQNGTPRSGLCPPGCGCGEKARAFCGKQAPARWSDKRRQGMLYLTFEDADAEIHWRDTDGKARGISVTSHQFCIIPLNLPHTCEWRCSAHIAFVRLRDAWLKSHPFATLGAPVVADFQPLARFDTCLWSLSTIVQELCRSGDRPTDTFVEGVGMALALRILEQHRQGPNNGPAAKPRLSNCNMQRVTEYVETHLQESLTVADLAKHVGLSVDHFSRLLKNTTGVSPLQFLLKCRVEKALELLRTGEFRVAEAACEVGFYDQSHFDRHCRKFFGFPPKVVMRFGGSSLKSPESSNISVA